MTALYLLAAYSAVVDDLTQRLQRLEEAHAFGEHTIDQLADELRRAFAEIELLRKRVAHLEEGARASEEPEAADEAPE